MEDKIFRKGSKTYYHASRLFSPEVRDDVAKLYSFVRVADNFVDAVPQDVAGFERLAGYWERYKHTLEYHELRKGDDSEWVTANMLDVVRAYDMPTEWVDAFLASMRQDTRKKKYRTIRELESYIYGSAEVIGLMMARLMRLPDEAEYAARRQGAAMQLINFIRDVAEDQRLGRQYLPTYDMRKVGIASLAYDEVRQQPEQFKAFIDKQLDRYHEWQQEAREGFDYLPTTQRRAVSVAVDGYDWTARQIRRHPLVIYERQLKPPMWYLAWRSLVRRVTIR